MSAEENKEIVRRFYEEVMNQGNLATLHEVMAEDFTDHGETLFGSPPNRDVLEQGIKGAHGIFPDLHVGLEDLVAAGDYVAARGTMRCTHKGEFLGVAATGNELSWKGIALFRLENGKIVERWFNSDSLSIAQQLGVVSLPGG